MLTSRRVELFLLAVIVLAYFGIAALYAIKTPAWQIPDEPAHYNYVAQVAANGCCPVIQVGDWNSDYLEQLKSHKFAQDYLGDLSKVRYEDHQPPLYYLLESPVYAASHGNLIPMRLLSVLLSVGVVFIAWLAIRAVFPEQPWLALASAAFVAFLPQHVTMMAGVENDSLAELIGAAILLASILYLTNSEKRPHPMILGLLLGIAVITKVTIYAIGAVVLVAVILRARHEGWPFSRFVRELVLIAIPALPFAIIWWGHNIQVYGWPDFLGLRRHDLVVADQLRTSTDIATIGFNNWWQIGLQTAFDSFWGQFGWMGVPMPDKFYTALLAFSIFVVIGAIIAFIRFRKRLSVQQRDGLILFFCAGLLALAGVVYYNLTFVQFQGRYLYPGLIPIALFVAIGLAGWASLLASRIRLIYWAIVPAVMLFALLDIYALYKFIIPFLTP